MPGFDGTGPCGKGPMTGRGDGYCMFKLSGSGTEPVEGFAGYRGRPVCLPGLPGSKKADQGPWAPSPGSLQLSPRKSALLPLFCLCLRTIAARIAEFEWRVARLEASQENRALSSKSMASRHSPQNDCVRRPQGGGSS